MDPWISLVTLGVRDIERSRRFYQDGLGWPLSAASTEDVAFFRTGGVVLALYKRESLAADANLAPVGSGFTGVALAHNVATRDLVDSALEAAVTAGGTLLRAWDRGGVGRLHRLLRRSRRLSVGGRLEPGISAARGWHNRLAVAGSDQSLRRYSRPREYLTD